MTQACLCQKSLGILAKILGRNQQESIKLHLYCWDLCQAVGTKPDPIIANSAVVDSSHIHSNMIEGQNKHFRWQRDSQLDHIPSEYFAKITQSWLHHILSEHINSYLKTKDTVILSVFT